jgi:hypothetical protein
VRTAAIVVRHPFSKDAPQVTFVPRKHPVEALAPNRTYVIVIAKHCTELAVRSAVNTPSARSPIFAMPRMRSRSTFAVTRTSIARPPSVDWNVNWMSWLLIVPRTCDSPYSELVCPELLRTERRLVGRLPLPCHVGLCLRVRLRLDERRHAEEDGEQERLSVSRHERRP